MPSSDLEDRGPPHAEPGRAPGAPLGGRRILGPIGLLGALALFAPDAAAQQMSLRARTVYHAYQIQLAPLLERSPIVNLNRFYVTLDGAGWGLSDGDVDVVFSLRYDTDFGTGFNRDQPVGTGVQAATRGAHGAHDLDLMFAYVDIRNVVHRRVDARIGRQLILDDLAWYVIDGARVSAHPWRDGVNFFDVELYAGLPVVFDTLFSSEPLLQDGTQVYDGRYPIPGVAFGGAAYLRAFEELSASFAYRQELVFRAGDIAAFRGVEAGAEASAGSVGLQESRIGGSLGYTIRPVNVDLFGHLTWDLLLGNMDQARAGASYTPTRALHVGGEYLRVRPRFAGDSIFNFFNIFPYDRGRFEVSWELLPGLVVDAGYLLQVFHGAATRGGETFQGSEASHGPMGGVSYRTLRWGAGAYLEAATNTSGQYAFGGNYRFGSFFGDLAFFEGRLVADARFTFTTVQSDWFGGLAEGQVAEPRTGYTGSLGARWQILDWLFARSFVVKNFSSPLEGNYRVFTELAVRY